MIWDYGNTLPDLLFICSSFHYLQMLSKNTEEKCVPLEAHSLKAEVRRNILFLLMQFYRELGKKKKPYLYASQKQIMVNNTKITDIKWI